MFYILTKDFTQDQQLLSDKYLDGFLKHCSFINIEKRVKELEQLNSECAKKLQCSQNEVKRFDFLIFHQVVNTGGEG